MPFLQLTMNLGARDPAPYEDLLFELGALSVTLEDAADDPVLEPAPGATPLWPTVRIKALFDSSADGNLIAERCRAFRNSAFRNFAAPGEETECAEDTECPALEVVDDRPWEREWLRDFKPMRFGERLWICPGGQTAGDRDAVRIELDPGLAFGTGTHPTTRLCLEWLDRHAPAGLSVIDYGCGSGILAIAALKLGAAHATGIDIDPQALIATRENAERNGVALDVLLADEARLTELRADLLLANILAGPLIDLAPCFGAIVRPGGRLVLAGLLADQSAAVTEAHRPWFDIAPFAMCDGWTLLAGRRHAP